MPTIDTMAFVFFVYGLSFFALGFAILVYPKHESVFPLASDLNYIAGFGLLHGINEWLDMFILINTTGNTLYLELIQAVTLPTSFLFLLIFGSKTRTPAKSGKHHVGRAITLGLLLLWALFTALSEKRILMGDIFARYLIGFPGAILAAYGLHQHQKQLQQTKLSSVNLNLRMMIGIFLIYSLLTGAIVKEAAFFPATILNYNNFTAITGVPIQIFRAAAAVLLAMTTLRVLKIFHWETQQRQEKDKLRLQTIGTAAPIILFQYDKQGQLIHIEGNYLKDQAIKVEQLIGQSIAKLLPGLDPAKIQNRAWKAGEVYNHQTTSHERTYLSSHTPTYAGDGQISGFVGAALDITQELHAQAQIDQYRHELHQIRQRTELGTLTTLVANKLRTPLNTTQLSLQRLLLNNEQHPQQQTLEAILYDITQAAKIVEDLHRQTHQAPPLTNTIPLNALFQRVIAIFAQRAQNQHLNINLDVPETIPQLSIPERELEYIVSALIECALEGERPQTENHQLNISYTQTSTTITLSFHDTQRTLTPEQQATLFQAFPETISQGQGCGLSMAVVQQIIQSHQGILNLQSPPNQGTRLDLTLPQNQTPP